MYKRNIITKLKKALTRSPVTLLLGARQTGKTTLIREVAGEKEYHYVSLDDIRFLSAAQHDPIGFLADMPKPLVIDEVQRVPELFLAIKHDVDLNRRPGRYVLTGSANPLLIPRIGDSLAGRVEIITLYPLSQGEFNNHVDSFIDTVWDAESFSGYKIKPCSRQELYTKILTGGYPSAQNIDEEDQQAWFNNYITTIIQKDVLDLSGIEALNAMPRLLSVLAMHAGSLLNASELSRQVGIPHSTLSRYLVLLKTIFLTFSQEPWHANFIRRIMKSPKSYFVDTGLLSWLSMMTLQRMRDMPVAVGPLLENFVMSELLKQETWNKTPVRLYHFRTADGSKEVDIILERFDGKIIGIEVKATATPTLKDAQGLIYLKEQTNNWHRGIILYTGDQIVPLAEGITALPVSFLWQV
jgi:predicted AAA+ superfamily ATPase